MKPFARRRMTHRGMLRLPILWLVVASLIAACTAPATPAPTAAPKPATQPTSAAQPTSVAQPTTAPKPAAQAAPTQAPAKPSPAPKKPLGKATLTYTTANPTNFVFYLAKEKGFYKEEGIDFDIQQVPSAVAIKAMIAGEYEFTAAVGTALAGSVSGDAPLKILWTSTTGSLAWLYAGKDIKSVAELKGKKVIIGAPGDFSQNLAKAALLASGLDPENDVVYVAAGGGSSTTRLRALIAGSGDAAILTPPENLIADQEKLSKLAFIGDFNLVTDGAATTEKLIKEKPELVQAFVRASLKGLKLFKAKKSEAVPLLAQYINVSVNDAGAIYDTVVNAFSTDGLTTDAVLRRSIEDQKKLSGVDRDVPVNQAFDLSFARKANEELAQANWKP